MTLYGKKTWMQIKFEKMVAIWKFVSEDKNEWNYIFHKCIEAIIKSWWESYFLLDILDNFKTCAMDDQVNFYLHQ